MKNKSDHFPEPLPPKNLRQKRWLPDPWLLLPVLLILGLGVILVYSSSSIYAATVYKNAEYFFVAHSLRIGLGLGLMFLTLALPRTLLQKFSLTFFIGSCILCLAVLLPGVGKLVGGGRRWLSYGPLTLQPSELAKIAVVLLLAFFFLAKRETKYPAALKSTLKKSGALERHPPPGLSGDQLPPALKPRTRWSLLGPLLVMQIPILLVLTEPDFGAALVMEMIVLSMIFAAGLRLRTILILALASLPLLYHLLIGTPFRLKRLLAYIDPWAYRLTVGYQVTEALISIGSGGIFGVGLGEGKHKLFFLPEAHTDFIFAILGEELGICGVLALLGAFALLIWRMARVALKALNDFDRYLAFGITAFVGIPVVVNTCVVTGLLPAKGLPLPLMSYGGSHLVVTLGALGMLLRIDRDIFLAERRYMAKQERLSARKT